MANENRILVTGASGHLGQAVLRKLAARGASGVIATTRRPESLAALAQSGVEVRAADFNQPAGLEAAFAGASTLLLISTLDLGSRVEQHGQAIDAAKRAGVRHVVYTSWPGAASSVALVSPDHAGTEEWLKKSGLAYTILGNYLYADLLLQSLPRAIETGTLYGATQDAQCAYIAREDCAEAAAAVLVDAARHANRSYDISGPNAYSYSEIAAIAAAATGKPIAYADLPPEAYQAALVAAGLPAAYADVVVSFDRAVARGEVARASADFEAICGHPAQDLAAFLTAALTH